MTPPAFPILATRAAEPVLLGSAMLAAVAAGAHSDIPAAMRAMSSSHPSEGGLRSPASRPSAGSRRSDANCGALDTAPSRALAAALSPALPPGSARAA